MITRPARVLRGLAAAFFAVFVAAFSHVAGGGAAPGAVGTALALAFSSVICVALAGRSLSTLRLSVSVVVSQVILHVLFTVGAAGSGGAVTMTTLHHGSVMVTLSGAGSAAGAESAAGAAAASGGASFLDALAGSLCSGMWIAHLAAAVLTIVALRRGEGAFWSLVSVAGLRFRRLLRPLFVEPVPVARVDRANWSLDPDHLRDRGVFLASLLRRGPPVCVRFAH